MSSEKTVDVLILGAGLSGLSAAYKLYKNAPHLTFLVAEANDRVGGRALSANVKGPKGQSDAFDLGGHWVCTRQTDIMNLIHELQDLEYYPQNITGTKIMQVGHKNTIGTYRSEIPSIGSIRGLIDLQLCINHIESLVKQVDIRDPYASPLAHILDSKSMEDLAREITDVPEVFDVLNAAFVATFGCDLSHISALFTLAYANAAGSMMNLLLVENQGAQEFRMKGGSQKIAQKLVTKIGPHRVLLNHEAIEIDQTGDRPKVLFQNGVAVSCKKVIITLPPNCIANLRFEPPLKHSKQRLYQNMVMGNLTKVYALFQSSFWLEEGFSGEVVSNGGPGHSNLKINCENGPVQIIFDATTSSGTPALVGFIAGKSSDQWNDLDSKDIEEGFLTQLESYFGPKIRTEFRGFLIKNWTQEPHIKGGPINYAAPGQMHNFHELRKGGCFFS